MAARPWHRRRWKARPLAAAAPPCHLPRQRVAPHRAAARPRSRSDALGDGQTAAAMAARRGRGDLLEAFERRGLRIELRGVESLIAACAQHDSAALHAIAATEPEL